MKKATTIRDVARLAGVSIATVSHVINGTQYVSPELETRVHEAIEALDYRPNRLAAALSTRKIPLLALVVPDISNPFWSSVARAVQDATDADNYSVIVCSTDGVFEREERFLKSLSGWVSGLLIHPYHVSHKHVSQHMRPSMPVVILGELADTDLLSPQWDQVGGSNTSAAQAAVKHLIDLGHERIAFIQGPPGTPTSIARLKGVYKEFEAAGLDVSEDLLAHGDYTYEGGRRAMRDLLERGTPPTAVFCANDLSALGALQTAQQLGSKVPADISIVGFDDITQAASTSPPLTTVKQSPSELGATGARLLLEQIGGRTEAKQISLEFSLVIRESTAPPAG